MKRYISSSARYFLNSNAHAYYLKHVNYHNYVIYLFIYFSSRIGGVNDRIGQYYIVSHVGLNTIVRFCTPISFIMNPLILTREADDLTHQNSMIIRQKKISDPPTTTVGEGLIQIGKEFPQYRDLSSTHLRGSR